MRRHLGLGVAEAEGLPWWEYRLYLEGMGQEFAGDDEGADGEVREVGSDPDSLRELGVTVT